MASTDRWQRAAATAAQKAKSAAVVAVREADRLLKAARTKAVTIARRRKLKEKLATTGRVLGAAGRAAVVAAVAAGIAAGRAELRRKKLKP
jgi:hypothetical protein